MKVKMKKLNDLAKMPVYGTKFSAGADLYPATDSNIVIRPGETKFVPTGIAVSIPHGYVGLVFARSGMACKRGLAPANKVGVIDEDYTGEIMVALHNHSKNLNVINSDDRIAQLVIVPYKQADFEVVQELDVTVRGEGGFGSTGGM